jgi:hypothetical protein
MKPGYKTTEFWLTLLANFAPMIAGALPPEQAAILGAVTAGVYTASRAYTKAKTEQPAR